ncbi:MAG: sugar ABC transporter [Planctomycetes bacterium]|nr:sugar ABC transporter [Planctomycetota bacterium]
MRGVRKAFGPVQALAGVDLEVRPGEVHALIGENGAGKSTLMKVLSGAHRADAGSMQLDGSDYRPSGPLDARAHGVAMIYQELTLAPHLSVLENIWLGREKRGRFGRMDRKAMRPAVEAALERLEHPDIRPETLVSALSTGARQLVEVARALVGEAKVLVMDEPTSSLSRKDTERLFQVVQRLREDGVSVIYISHFLEEVEEIADRFTVLRDGETVGSGVIGEVEIERIIEMMVGRSLDEVFPQVPHEAGGVALRAQGLRGPRLLEDASFELRAGEIFGIAGLVGAGRTELLRVLQGLVPATGGRFEYLAAAKTPSGLLSEDRKEEGLAINLSLGENLTLGHAQPLLQGPWLSHARRRSLTQTWIDELAVRCAGPDQPIGDLSGGNQQKIAFARLLHAGVPVLLLDEPTRGVDVGSKVEIYRLMGKLAAQGKALLVVSSYLPELLGVCDRIAVMHRGVLGPARPVAECTEHGLLEEATRGVGEVLAATETAR